MELRPSLHFVVPVWGESYVHTFLHYCLPAQLSPDNIPALDRGSCANYTIYTTRSDYDRIAVSPAFRSLCNAIVVKTEFIDAIIAGSAARSDAKYTVKSHCYRRALQRAAEHHEAVVALNADILLANGFVRTAVDLLARGKRVIKVPGPRGLRDPIGHTLIDLGPRWDVRRKESALFTSQLLKRYYAAHRRRTLQVIFDQLKGVIPSPIKAELRRARAAIFGGPNQRDRSR